MGFVILDTNYVPGYTVVQDGGLVWAKDYINIIEPTWTISRVLDSMTQHKQNQINRKVDEVVALLEKEAKRRGFNAVLCVRTSAQCVGEYATVATYEVYAEGIMCVIEPE